VPIIDGQNFVIESSLQNIVDKSPPKGWRAGVHGPHLAIDKHRETR